MCYSAQIWSDYKRYTRAYGAELSLKDFYELFWRRVDDPRVKIPKGMEMPFADTTGAVELEIGALIERYARDQTVKLEQELFKQRTRLADAQRSLQSKVTNAATESLRIATSKIDATIQRLSDLRRVQPLDRDSRIFPGHYAPVMIMENGKRVVKPMRYQCRPAGKPVSHDAKFPGTYNARRDNLEGFWKGLFGYSHGLVVVNAFYENVNRHRTEGRELAQGEAVENVVLEFKPRPAQDMLVACLWSHWTAPGQPDLLSFAAITDEPPPEIAAAGHDRCIIAIQPSNVDAWLNPDPANLAAQHAILEDRAIAFYEHQLAA
jgi:putative SOS response-associated peptidase YedK